jgi:hypothetical protein
MIKTRALLSQIEELKEKVTRLEEIVAAEQDYRNDPGIKQLAYEDRALPRIQKLENALTVADQIVEEFRKYFFQELIKNEEPLSEHPLVAAYIVARHHTQ